MRGPSRTKRGEKARRTLRRAVREATLDLPPDAPAKEAVLVSGMHRSGTAAASRALSFLGYSQPQLLTEAGPHNPTGYWQPVRIVQVNEEMIASLGWSWDHTPLLTQTASTPEEAEVEILSHLAGVWLDRAREAIRDSFRSDAARVVCKDPRISLFAPFWQAAFEAEGYAVKHVVAFREPGEVAASLKRAHDLDRGPALRAWLAYNLRPLAMAEVAATLDYAALVASPVETLNRLADDLGVGRLDDVAAGELEQFIDRTQAASIVLDADAELLTPKLVRSTHALLKDWKARDKAMDRRAGQLRAALTDAQLLFDRVWVLPTLNAAPAIYRVEESADAPAPSGEPRTVVVHYHLFKNAGTSVDTVLQANFGEDWQEVEFLRSRRRPNVAEVEAWLAEHPQVRALSSHTALGPPPRLPGMTVAPVIFVRHPIDRIRSAYEFERRQGTETRGSKLAKEVPFADYLRVRMAKRDRQCRNFQTYRFAAFADGPDERARALTAVRDLPFVGLVEDFAESMTRLETYLGGHFPAFRAFGAKENVWREGASLANRLDATRAEVGAALWAELLAANRDDLDLFAEAAARHGLSVDDLLAR